MDSCSCASCGNQSCIRVSGAIGVKRVGVMSVVRHYVRCNLSQCTPDVPLTSKCAEPAGLSRVNYDRLSLAKKRETTFDDKSCNPELTSARERSRAY